MFFSLIRYDQSKMRQHFLSCLQSGEMSPSPSELRLRSKRPVGIKKVNIYCDCRLPEDGEEPMVYCEGCKNWYHRSCQSIPDIVFDTEFKQDWFCNHCLV